MKNWFKNWYLKMLAAMLMIGIGASSALATDPPDASTIVTTASTTFNSVGALVAAVVSFFVIVKIVKWIRK